MATATELDVVQTSDASLIADTIFGDGVTVVSSSLTGNAVQSGIYSGADTTMEGVAPSDTGVIFSTGNTGDITNSSGTTDTNTAGNTGTNLTGSGDADLTALGGNNTFDAIVFNATFVPTGDFLTMQFTLSSEEYLEYVNSGVNDVFGVWVNGTFAELTPTLDAVSIDTVNQGTNPNLYVDNAASDDTYNTEMDGLTVTLSMKAPVTAGEENTIKIGLADGGDGVYDSNIMIAANSAQTIALAMSDEVDLAPNSSRVIEILANDYDEAGGGLTITEINGTPVSVGQTVTLGTGEQITLNDDGTITVLTDSDITTSSFTYEVTDANGVTDVGYVTMNTVAPASLAPDGIVDGSSAGDTIIAGYTGDPDGDLVDGNDALGVEGTTGDGDYIRAFGGGDSVEAGAGDDIVFGGSGSDTIDGGAGADTLYGGNTDEVANLIVNGSFEDLTGTVNTGWGDQGSGSIVGWTDYAGGDFDLHDNGKGGTYATDGTHVLDMGGTPDNLHVYQDVAGVIADEVYNLTLDAGDVTGGGNSVELYWGGELIATIDPVEGGMESFAFDLIGGAGDGANRLEFKEIGPTDVDGVQLDNIQLVGATSASSTPDTSGDSIDGGTGDDTVYGLDGDDTLDGGDDNDTLYGSAGSDTLNGDDGDDAIYGGAGDDTFNVAVDNGSDTIIGGEDTVGGDVDTLNFTDGTGPGGLNVVMSGDEAGDYTFDGQDGDGTFTEIEAFDLTDQNDTFDGSASTGGTTVDAGAGDDSLTGGTGADSLTAGSGNDTITVSDGDTVDGGSGNDNIVLEDLGEPSNGTITIDGGSGDETGGDTLQLGTLGVLTNDVIDTFVDDGTGSFSGSITLDDGTILNFSEIENIICFTPGTRIATPRGLVAVEALKVGDRVVTRDHGLQPIRWVEARTVPAVGRFAPVRIGKNVLAGQDCDLVVSPQHRVLFHGYHAELLFGETEVLVSAKHLIDGINVTQEAGDEVTYLHFMFDQHEIIFAEGVATESFHPGDLGLSAVSDEAREELFAIFPELRTDQTQYGKTARRCLKGHEGKLIRF